MSLILINVGTEANDGSGDPPRIGALKINANFEAIDQALAATETTDQLDARDTANRARANHTGTQTTSTIANFASEAAAAAPVQSVAGKTGEVLLAKADVGLGQADNTSDIDKPLSTATEAALGQLASSTQAALDQKLEAGDIAAFETNAQLDARDTANRARANHTGAQAISTVTGLQTALNAKLEASAIASFETTTQLNARDTANRARANHTGTQPASSITGLATVATSGSYNDLTSKPPIPFGFTYDQQAEPAGATAGQTWRERSSGGLIVGQWEWTGSVWASIDRTTMSGVAINGAAASYPSVAFEAPRCLFTQCRISVTQQGNPATPFDASNYRELFLARSLTTAANAVFTFRPLISLAQGHYVSAMNYLNPSGASFFTGTTVVGSPGTLHAPGVSWVYREVRA